MGEGNEIIAGQYSVMGWDLVKVNVSWISIPETMFETEEKMFLLLLFKLLPVTNGFCLEVLQMLPLPVHSFVPLQPFVCSPLGKGATQPNSPNYFCAKTLKQRYN